jgi:hypothetical protein
MLASSHAAAARCQSLLSAGLGSLTGAPRYLSSQTVERSWFRKWLGLIFQPLT